MSESKDGKRRKNRSLGGQPMKLQKTGCVLGVLGVDTLSPLHCDGMTSSLQPDYNLQNWLLLKQNLKTHGIFVCFILILFVFFFASKSSFIK